VGSISQVERGGANRRDTMWTRCWEEGKVSMGRMDKMNLGEEKSALEKK
jgi:hypothetical protein